MSPAPNADLWTHARALLAAFTHAWGSARDIALKWTMIDEIVGQALKALAPAEALARRLVFAHALTLAPGARAPSPASGLARAPAGEGARAPIPHDPLAFRRAMFGEMIHLRRPLHEMERPPEGWRTRFTVAQFEPAPRPQKEKDPSRRTAGASPAYAGPDFPEGPARAPAVRHDHSASPPVVITRNRAQRRAFASFHSPRSREDAWIDYMMQPVGAPSARPVKPRFKWPQKISSEPLAKRIEALRRVIDDPTRAARHLARRIARFRSAVLVRVVQRWRRLKHETCALACDRIAPLLDARVDTS